MLAARIRVRFDGERLSITNTFRSTTRTVAEIASVDRAVILNLGMNEVLAVRLRDGSKVRLMALPLSRAPAVTRFITAMDRAGVRNAAGV